MRRWVLSKPTSVVCIFYTSESRKVAKAGEINVLS